MTRIFSQGSVQNSDKNTDVAIQGDGFFIISPDGGNTYKYTRAGDFKFDAGGNFVDNNGFIVQGWLRDKKTGKVDSTAPITNINIAPGLTTPAHATQEVVLKANLNSGGHVKSYSPAYTVASVPVPTPAPTSNNDLSGNEVAKDNNGSIVPSGNLGVMFNSEGDAFALQENEGVWISFREAVYDGSTVGDDATLDIYLEKDDGTKIHIEKDDVGNASQNANAFAAEINKYSLETGVKATVENDAITLININNTIGGHNIRLTTGANNNNSGLSDATRTTAYKYSYIKSGANPNQPGDNKTFTTLADLRYAMEVEARNVDANGDGSYENSISIATDDKGRIVISNTGNSDDDYNINLKITPIVDKDAGIRDNSKFTKNMQALNTVIQKNSSGKAYSQEFTAATHSSSIDIFDSLGSKHTLRMEFRKTAVEDKVSKWALTVTVENPSVINKNNPNYPANELRGEIRFNSDGSYLDNTLPPISFTAGNGSAPDQPIDLFLGSTGKFDGMTSFDNPSSTSGISQDGYTGGDLVGIRIDQSGTLVGSFSNGRSFGLAQIAMAKFTNNEGLSTEGGNVFIQTANSGDPIIGTAATSGRGFIQSAALEASNVDLSRALTQLIIIQRGFQANGKTITTSDQLLETLIGLKR
jgi:flagellar hook protein FlgE